MRTVRVFPRRTAFTPRDEYAFVGDPPMLRPEAQEVHISVTFTWDCQEADHLALAWAQYYPTVRIGGPAIGRYTNGFTPGEYIRQGVTFTSRGCNNRCPWCLVPKQEGRLREIPIHSGNIVQDNNLLQCGGKHLRSVFRMLRQERQVQFTGGLDSRLITDRVAEDLRTLRISQLFLACDTRQAIKPLGVAVKKLNGLSRDKLRCYVLLAYNGESISEANERLREVWHAGAMPFAQLYQPPDRHIDYPQEWRQLARTWSRPAATRAVMRQEAK